MHFKTVKNVLILYHHVTIRAYKVQMLNMRLPTFSVSPRSAICMDSIFNIKFSFM